MSRLPASISPVFFALQWIQAIVFFVSLEPHTGLQIQKRILRELLSSSASSPSSVDPKLIAKLYANIGYIHGFLGEYYEAATAFNESCMHDDSSILAWFGLGSARSQLQQFTRAGQAFLMCRELLDELHIEGADPGIWIDYYEMKWTPAMPEDVMYGLKPKRWYLNRVRIEWNIRMAFFDKVKKAEGTALAGVWGSNGVPAGTIFGPPPDFIPGGIKRPSPVDSLILPDCKPSLPLPPPPPPPIEKIRFGIVPCHPVAITTVSPPPSPPIPVPASLWKPNQWQPWKRSGHEERFFVPDFNTLLGSDDPDTPVAPVFPPRGSSLQNTSHQPSVDDGFLLPATRYEG